jgi:hypothetical protein
LIGANLISDALPFGRLWYDGRNAISNAVGFAKFFSRSRNAVIRVYDAAGNVITTHEHKGEFSRLPHRKGSAVVAFCLFQCRNFPIPAVSIFRDL